MMLDQVLADHDGIEHNAEQWFKRHHARTL